MLIEKLNNLVIEKKAHKLPNIIIINSLKEYLQYPVLSYIYKNKNYQNYIFMGGSALRIIYNLARLSEDLDFNLRSNDFKNLNLEKLGTELKEYFFNTWQLDISYRAQKNSRLYLKFPILKKLRLAQKNDSDFLFVKIEPQKEDFKNSEIELNPISKDSFNFICQNYNLKFLMTGKISAILERSWYKEKNNEINIKGRDYYDLFWYLKNKVEPDYFHLNKKFAIKNKEELNKVLTKQIKERVNSRQLLFDLENFFIDQEFIRDFCNNYSTIISKYLK
jgi:predicted nucleotidyltransferase component of viral defense system